MSAGRTIPLLCLLLCISSVSPTTTTTTTARRRDIHIGGLFPMNGTTGWLGGGACKPAVDMALNDVNKYGLVNGYRLNLHWNNSQCDPGLGATVLYDLVYKPPIKTLILCGCSTECSLVAEVAKMYNLIVIGYGSSSPALSDKARFPTFFRTHPSATIHNPTRIQVFKKFSWTRIAIILEAHELFVTTAKDLEWQCQKDNIEVTRVSFLDDPADAVKSLVRQDYRIIVGMFYSAAARRVMCEAYKHRLFGPRFVWFLIGWYEDNWFQPVPGLNCTKNEMLAAVEGHITTEALMLNQDQQKTIAGVSASVWLEDYKKKLIQGMMNHEEHEQGGHSHVTEVDHQNEGIQNQTLQYPEGFQEAPLAYDAIWAIAKALNDTIEVLESQGLSLDKFNYNNQLITNQLKASLMGVDYLGVSGRVKFSEEQDRIAWTWIEQLQNGKYVTIGYYDTQTDNLTWINPIIWTHGRPPRDRTQVVTTFIRVRPFLFIILSAIASIGVILSLILIGFNRKFSHYRFIAASNPTTNNVMLFGCASSLGSVVLFGLDGQSVGENHFTTLCLARAWMLSLGFSLLFGAMFAKVWAVHWLHTQGKKRTPASKHVMYIIGGLCLIDIIALTGWQMRQPMDKSTERVTDAEPVEPNEDLVVNALIEKCEMASAWYGLLFAYKGLLLIFGLFLAYETRSVKLKTINDSRLVGMAIYNVVILCAITAPTSLFIRDQPDSHFAFISLAIIFCCLLTMGLVFVPKVVEVVRRKDGGQLNGQFQETLTSREEQERIGQLANENDILQARIRDKDRSIEEVKAKIQDLINQQIQVNRRRKTVRIQESEDHKEGHQQQSDPDSGFMSTKNNKSSEHSESLSESYL